MTLLSIAQDVLNEIGDFEVPGSIVNNSSITAKRALQFANLTGEELAREANWQALLTTHTFTTTASTAAYTIPTDYRHFVNATWWDRTNYWEMFGPATPQQWQTLKSGIVTDGVRRFFRVQGDQFYIHPTPTSTGDTIAYEYISADWARSSGDVAQAKFEADTDTSVLDEYLIKLGCRWRFLRVNGLPYEEEYARYSREVEKAVGRDGGAPTLVMSRDPNWFRDVGIVNIPESGFGS